MDGFGIFGRDKYRKAESCFMYLFTIQSRFYVNAAKKKLFL